MTGLSSLVGMGLTKEVTPELGLKAARHGGVATWTSGSRTVGMGDSEYQSAGDLEGEVHCVHEGLEIREVEEEECVWGGVGGLQTAQADAPFRPLDFKVQGPLL